MVTICGELNKMKNDSRKSRDGGAMINIVRALSGVMPNCIGGDAKRIVNGCSETFWGVRFGSGEAAIFI
jgi:hypothetical protein